MRVFFLATLLVVCLHPIQSFSQTAKDLLLKGNTSLDNGLWAQAEVYFSESIHLEKTAEAYLGRARANEKLNKATQFCDDLRIAACAESAVAHQLFIQKCGMADTAFVDTNFQVCEKEKSAYLRIQYSTSFPSEALNKYYTRDWKVFKFDWPLSEVFTVVEESPEYPGGTGALIKFIQTNLIAPNSVLQGKVHLKFVVNELGDISRIDILQGLNEECDAEAIRVVKLMPRWKPGKQNGQPVKVYYNLPISFRIR